MKILIYLEHLSEEEIETIFQNTNQAKADRAETQDHIVVINQGVPFWRTFKCSNTVKDEIISFCKDKEIVQTIIDVVWEELSPAMQDAISLGVVRIESPENSFAPIILKVKNRKEVSYGVFKDNAPEGFRQAVLEKLGEKPDRMKVLDRKLKAGTITEREIAELAKLISQKLGGIK